LLKFFLIIFSGMPLSMETIEQRIQQVCADREHGSRWLVNAAITILHDLAQDTSLSQAERLSQLYARAYQVAQARPAMGALASAVGRIISVHEGGPEAIAQEAQQLLTDLDTAPQSIAQHAQAFLSGHLMTCSISGTVLSTLLALKGQIEHVTVLEGRPRYEGRAMAQALHEQGIPVTLITDAQADIFLPQCQSIVVGADSILVNGDVLNKAGTALLAWAAHGHGIDLHVLSETIKISPHRWYEHNPARIDDNLSLLEEKEASEVFEHAPEGIKVRNFYFDHTPYRLVTNFITEQGLLNRRSIREIAVTTRANERLMANLQKN
jgi:ribose 1,5-bisphosphate isomerase